MRARFGLSCGSLTRSGRGRSSGPSMDEAAKQSFVRDKGPTDRSVKLVQRRDVKKGEQDLIFLESSYMKDRLTGKKLSVMQQILPQDFFPIF